MTSEHSVVSLERRGSVALITVEHPPVNAINHAVRVGLMSTIREIGDDRDVKAAVIAASGRTFMAGSDIREFDAPSRSPLLKDVVAAIEALSVPVVAAIHGTALGGGLELAIGCHYRVARADAKVGQPEIALGLIPGAGGTQRLPRLIGVERALDAILTGRHISSTDALAMGLVDEIAEGDLLACAEAAALRLASSGQLRRTREIAVSTAHDPDFFAKRRAAAAARWPNDPAPVAAVDAVEAAITLPFEQGMAREADISARLKASVESRARRHLFFAERIAARIPDIPDAVDLRPVTRVGIVGAGTMGRGIALSFLNAGFPVTIVDSSQEALDRGLSAIAAVIDRDVEKGRLSAEGRTTRLAMLSGAAEIAQLADADLVIEAAFENMEIKREIFSKLDKVCKPNAILASNTSTLDVNRIAEVTDRPGDVLGMHFFSPAHVMKLLEVIRAECTSPDALATVMDVAKRIRKTAVVSRVCFGFIGNRMFEGYVRESQMLLLEGSSPFEVDQALVDFGMAMGPCAVIDLAGVDVSYLTREGNRANLPPDPRYCAVGDRLHALGRYGQKTGKGFYRYENGRAMPDPDVDAIIRAEAERLQVSRRAIPRDEIVARCIYPLINEGAKILDEKIALRGSDIDVVWCTGYGFPRLRGGPLFHADTVGLESVLKGMSELAARDGDRFGYWTPAPLLQRSAATGAPLSAFGA